MTEIGESRICMQDKKSNYEIVALEPRLPLLLNDSWPNLKERCRRDTRRRSPPTFVNRAEAESRPARELTSSTVLRTKESLR